VKVFGQWPIDAEQEVNFDGCGVCMAGHAVAKDVQSLLFPTFGVNVHVDRAF
jgi:hypothetical protein